MLIALGDSSIGDAIAPAALGDSPIGDAIALATTLPPSPLHSRNSGNDGQDEKKKTRAVPTGMSVQAGAVEPRTGRWPSVPQSDEELLAAVDRAMAVVAAERAAWRAATDATAAALESLAPRDTRDGSVDWAHAIRSIERASATVTWSHHFGGCYLVTDGPAFQRLCEEYRECHGPGSTTQADTSDMGRFFVLWRGAHWTHTGAVLAPRHRRNAGLGRAAATARHSPRTTTGTRVTRVRAPRA